MDPYQSLSAAIQPISGSYPPLSTIIPLYCPHIDPTLAPYNRGGKSATYQPIIIKKNSDRKYLGEITLYFVYFVKSHESFCQTLTVT